MTFDSIGGEQTYVVPPGVTSIRVEAVGGKGADGTTVQGVAPAGVGGFGADVLADIPVAAGETLYVEVAGNAPNDGTGTAGFNGGGAAATASGAGGGGASDVRMCSRAAASCAAGTDTLASRVVVAGGGGGGGGDWAAGGGDGGVAGSDGHSGSDNTSCRGSGGAAGGAATASAGGAGGAGGVSADCFTPSPVADGASGSFAQGGTGGYNQQHFIAGLGGGGGGGWFGGGGGGGGSAGTHGGGGGGGGGSSFVTSFGSNASIGADPTGTPRVVITPVQGVPSAATGMASGVTATGATLNGVTNPDGASTSYHFEYGTTTSYGLVTAAVDAGSGTSDQPASFEVSGLLAGTTYHFRLVATNHGGTTAASDQTFDTPPAPAPLAPLANTGAATRVGSTGATLSGVVNPNGGLTRYHFVYGRTAAYGHSTPSLAAGFGSLAERVSVRLSGLASNATYHYRLDASSSAGTTPGTDRTFRTAPAVRGAFALGQTDPMTHGGDVSVMLSCPLGTPGSCIGILILKPQSQSGNTSVRRALPVIGQASFTVRSGHRAAIRVHLSGHGQAMVRAMASIKVVAIVRSRDGTNRKTQQSSLITLRARP